MAKKWSKRRVIPQLDEPVFCAWCEQEQVATVYLDLRDDPGVGENVPLCLECEKAYLWDLDPRPNPEGEDPDLYGLDTF